MWEGQRKERKEGGYERERGTRRQKSEKEGVGEGRKEGIGGGRKEEREQRKEEKEGGRTELHF